ncbi:MAG: SxtJ family membrane protein [Cyclobacteriaceae bacterium]
MNLEATELSAGPNRTEKGYIYFSLTLVGASWAFALYLSDFSLTMTLWAKILLAASVLILLILLVKPILLRKLYKGWLVLGRILQTVNTFIILSLIYIVLIIPVGFLFRTFSASFKKYKFDSNKDSYWDAPSITDIDLRKQF